MTESQAEIPIKDLPIEDLEVLLQDSLRPDDLEEAKAIKREISAVINWGNLTQSVGREIFGMIEELCRGQLPELTKSPVAGALVGDGRRIMENESADGRAIRYMVFFLLTKKLLGALKTDVNKKMGRIRHLTEEETEAIEEIIADEDLLVEAESLDQTESDTEIVARLERGLCPHNRTIIRTDEEAHCLEKFCKECRTVVERLQDLGRVIVEGQDDGRPSTKKSKKCQHHYLSWVEGEEGKVAR